MLWSSLWSTQRERNQDRGLVLRSSIILHVILLAAGEATLASESPPQLSRRNSTSYFLRSSDIWEPGTITFFTWRKVNEPIKVNIVLLPGPASLGKPSFFLLYKCSADAHIFVEIPLQNIDTSDTLCEQRQPFMLQRLNESGLTYNLTLLNSKKEMRFEESLQAVEFTLLIRYPKGVLYSSSLHVFNWDWALNLQTITRVASNYTYTRYILTNEAIQFLSRLTATDGAAFLSVPFLEQQFVKLVEKSPLIVRSHFALSLIVRFSNISCESAFDALSDVYISTGEYFLTDAPVSSFNDGFYDSYSLNINTGKLTLSNAKFWNMLFATASRSNNGLVARVCLRISANSRLFDYQVVKTVMTFKVGLAPKSEAIAQGTMNKKTDCRSSMVTGTSSLELLLVAGMRDVIIKAPTVCISLSHLNVHFNGSLCTRGLHQEFGVLINCGAYFVDKLGAIILFPGELNWRHSGTYSFGVGIFTFSYHVTVVSLPFFTSFSESGLLQPKVHAFKYTPLFNLSCTVFHSGMPSVLLESHFQRINKDVLDDLPVASFTADSGMIQNYIRKNHSTTLAFVAPRLKSIPASLTIIAACKAYMAQTESLRLVGSRKYVVETQSQVIYNRQDMWYTSEENWKNTASNQVGTAALTTTLIGTSLAGQVLLLLLLQQCRP